MTCDDRATLSPLYAAGACDHAERDELRAHLAAGCPRCAGALADYQATLALLPAALDPIAPPRAAKDRLMQRIRGESRSMSLPLRPQRRFVPLSRLAIAALIAAAIGGATVWFALASRQAGLVAQLADKSDAIRRANADLNDTRETLRFLRSPDLRVAELTGTKEQPGAGLRIFWDPAANTWSVFARNLKPLPPGQAYELWYIPVEKSPVAIGHTFTPDASGNATLVFHLPKDLGPLALAAITNERAEGVPTPSGALQATGKLLAIP